MLCHDNKKHTDDQLTINRNRMQKDLKLYKKGKMVSCSLTTPLMLPTSDQHTPDQSVDPNSGEVKVLIRDVNSLKYSVTILKIFNFMKRIKKLIGSVASRGLAFFEVQF
jgi:hypothetical protein